MRIATCDDSNIDRTLICELIRIFFEEVSIKLELEEYDNGVNLLYDIEDGINYDVIFLDIFMNDILGIDVARKLRELKYEGKIIFLTSTSEFAVESYDVRAYNYLLKPISYEKLKKVCQSFIDKTEVLTYPVKQRSNITFIPYSEITYIESRNAKCILHRNNYETYTIYKHLSVILEELEEERFLRCHQSFIVNMDYIEEVGHEFVLTTGDVVMVKQKELKNMRNQYLEYRRKRVQKKRGRVYDGRDML